MAALYFHYTSRVAAQLIIAAGQLLPNGEGIVYVASDDYASGADAANRLGLPVTGPIIPTPNGLVALTKTIEVVCLIPNERLPLLPRAVVGPAAPYHEYGTNRMLYSGRGYEVRYPGSIDVRGLTWRSLTSP